MAGEKTQQLEREGGGSDQITRRIGTGRKGKQCGSYRIMSMYLWLQIASTITHMGKIVIGMREVVEINELIFVVNDTTAQATKKGTLDLMLIQTNRDTAKISLEDYKYSPEMGRCLFSIMKALQKG
jgi:hypothetical protein